MAWSREACRRGHGLLARRIARGRRAGARHERVAGPVVDVLAGEPGDEAGLADQPHVRAELVARHGAVADELDGLLDEAVYP